MRIIITFILLLFAVSTFKLDSTSVSAYNLQLSKTYSAYGILSYCPKKCLQNWTCDFSKNYPKLINVTHINNDITLAAAFVGYEPQSKVIVISWRGSANAENWIQDFTFDMEPFSGCKGCWIHVGFNADYHLNQKKIFAQIDILKKAYSVSKIVLSGHSLGAALASVNAIYLAVNGETLPIEVYNIGSPRFANANLAQFVKQKVPGHYRIVHHKDLIPHLPPQVEYHHVANEIFFNADMSSYKVCDDTGEDHTCSNQYFPQYNPGDHNFYFVDLGKVKC